MFESDKYIYYVDKVWFTDIVSQKISINTGPNAEINYKTLLLMIGK